MDNNKKRIYLLDIIRGILIIYVMYYHFMYDLNDIVGKNVPYLYSTWFSTIRDCMSGSLIFISGISCNFSRNNLKRGLRTLVVAMALTLITYIVMPDQFIIFGILHFLGSMMTIYGLVALLVGLVNKSNNEKDGNHTSNRTTYSRQKMVIRIVIAIFSMFLFFTTYTIYYGFIKVFGKVFLMPVSLYGSFPMYLMGFIGPYYSADYYPIIPWCFLFFSGSMLGYIFKRKDLPAFLYKNFCKPLAFIGRHTMIIYLVHQPLFLGIFMLIANFTNK